MVQTIEALGAWTARCVGGVVIVLVGVFIAGQVRAADTFKPAPPPPPGQALVYIYRAPNFSNGARMAEFDVDGIKIASLRNRTYTWFYVPAHAHTLKLTWTTLGIRFPSLRDAYIHDEAPVYVWKNGKTYYYRFQSTLQGIYPGMVIATMMDTPSADDALSELAIYRYSPAFNLEKLEPAGAAAKDPAPPTGTTSPSTSGAEATPSR